MFVPRGQEMRIGPGTSERVRRLVTIQISDTQNSLADLISLHHQNRITLLYKETRSVRTNTRSSYRPNCLA
jgi:hypothetical protein